MFWLFWCYYCLLEYFRVFVEFLSFLFVVLRMEHRASHTLIKHYPWATSQFYFLLYFIMVSLRCPNLLWVCSLPAWDSQVAGIIGMDYHSHSTGMVTWKATFWLFTVMRWVTDTPPHITIPKLCEISIRLQTIRRPKFQSTGC